jgi:hypothetical protein
VSIDLGCKVKEVVKNRAAIGLDWADASPVTENGISRVNSLAA